MPYVTLLPHPTTPGPAIRRLGVRLRRAHGGMLTLEYAIEGDMDALRIPDSCPPRCAEGLWQHTCFEAFLREDGLAGYCEFNFAPSTEWAAYRFEGYRTGMSDLRSIRPPAIIVRRDARRLELTALADPGGLGSNRSGRDLRLALSAVIETEDGGLTYWALRHPPGRPDFHHPDGFALRLDPQARAGSDTPAGSPGEDSQAAVP